MELFDLHCDTAWRMRKQKLPFSDSRLSVNAGALASFSRVTQVFALFSDPGDTDEEAARHLLQMADIVRRETAGLPRLRAVLSVEDARGIGYDPGRLPMLAAMGVRMLGPFWRGESPLGSAHDATPDRGLTEKGRAFIRACFACGITPDIAHASRRSADEILSMAEGVRRPVCCSHTAFAALCPHTRCITDEEAARVAATGGLVGICMVPAFLGGDTDRHILDQFRHGIAAGLGASLSLGCDFDGTDTLPRSIEGTKDLPYLFRLLCEDPQTAGWADAIFSGNAGRFCARWWDPENT